MQTLRASAVLVCALGALAGCASSRLSSEPPPGVRLAGDWKLDAAHSDDLGVALQQLREQSHKARREMRDREAAGAAAQSEGPQQGGLSIGPGPQVSAMDELLSNVPQGDYLTISASAAAFTVTSGDSSNQYTPGQESEISAQQGDAQQISGWKGADYVIDTRPQWGPEIIQSYGLTKDGQLLMKLSLSGPGIRFTFNRLYVRTTRVAPLAPPTTN